MVRRTEPLNVSRKNRPRIREYRERNFPEFRKGSRNFCRPGADHGDAVIVMDCDLQHPPEVIPQMWEKWQQGAEIVEGIKSDRGRERVWDISCLPDLFYKIMSKLIKMDMNASSDFKLLDRKVVQVLLELPERNTFFRALTFWAGFRQRPWNMKYRRGNTDRVNGPSGA